MLGDRPGPRTVLAAATLFCLVCTVLTGLLPGLWPRAGGVMNMAGNFGGVVSTALVPILVKQFGWVVALGSGSAVALLGAVIWFRIRVEAAEPD